MAGAGLARRRPGAPTVHDMRKHPRRQPARDRPEAAVRARVQPVRDAVPAAIVRLQLALIAADRGSPWAAAVWRQPANTAAPAPVPTRPGTRRPTAPTPPAWPTASPRPAHRRPEADPVPAQAQAPRWPPTRSATTASTPTSSRNPHVIVEHYTAGNSFSSAYNTFAPDTPDVELHELPGVCAHFVIDTRRHDLPARPARDHVPPHGRPELHGDRDRARRHLRQRGARQPRGAALRRCGSRTGCAAATGSSCAT